MIFLNDLSRLGSDQTLLSSGGNRPRYAKALFLLANRRTPERSRLSLGPLICCEQAVMLEIGYIVFLRYRKKHTEQIDRLLLFLYRDLALEIAIN